MLGSCTSTILVASVVDNLDQYFTPQSVAQRIVETVEPRGDSFLCVDPTCGSGNLLSACEAALPGAVCVGIDRDARVIRNLRRAYPHWRLSVADLLCDRSLKAAAVFRTVERVSLLVLNPPFSQSGRKSLGMAFGGEQFRVSPAMGYVLRSFEVFRPQFGAVAVVPESLLYSDVDREARCAIAAHYSVRELFELRSSTFSGARARTVAVQFLPSAGVAVPSSQEGPSPRHLLKLVRGCLAVHHALLGHGGTPYIHTTDLAEVVGGGPALRRTRASCKRSVSGWQILLPRVGAPKEPLVNPVFLPQTTELSDCVLGLGADVRVLNRVANLIRKEWLEFSNLYRGTGARYITVGRLATWFHERGFAVVVD